MIDGLVIPKIQLRFHPRETAFPAYIDEVNKLVKTSVCIKPVTYNEIKYVYVEYQIEYEENPAIGLGCIGRDLFPHSECLGYHEGDTERIGLLFSVQDKRVEQVLYKAHGRGQGQWRDFEDCPKTDQGTLICYVARGSHAHYFETGVKWRIFGFANDLCSDNGIHYILHSGPDKHDTPYNPNMTSITPTERFFYPLIVDRIRQRGDRLFGKPEA
jgi:hypothetical protein